MSKSWKFVIAAVLLGGACVAVGVLVWQFGGPSGPARKLLGVWEVMGSGFEDAINIAIEQNDPEVARAVGDKFGSNERIYFDRNGSCRHVQNLLGLTITSDGTWQAAEASEGILSVKFHKKKLSLRDQKGDTKEESQDAVVEWGVSMIESDRLSVAMTTDGKTQRFALRRARE